MKLFACIICLTPFITFGQNEITVYFDFNKQTPLNANILVSNNPNAGDTVFVTGYTDQVGTTKYNKILALQRVNSVLKYFPNNLVVVKNAYGKHFDSNLLPTQMRKVTIAYTSTKVPVQVNPIKLIEKKILKDSLNFLLSKLFFIENTYFPIPAQKSYLAEAADLIKLAIFKSIKIIGHSNIEMQVQDTGIVFKKIDLSEARARYVYLYFVEQGLDANKMRYVGKQNLENIVPPNAKNAEINMRVNFEVE